MVVAHGLANDKQAVGCYQGQAKGLGWALPRYRILPVVWCWLGREAVRKYCAEQTSQSRQTGKVDVIQNFATESLLFLLSVSYFEMSLALLLKFGVSPFCLSIYPLFYLLLTSLIKTPKKYELFHNGSLYWYISHIFIVIIHFIVLLNLHVWCMFVYAGTTGHAHACMWTLDFETRFSFIAL